LVFRAIQNYPSGVSMQHSYPQHHRYPGGFALNNCRRLAVAVLLASLPLPTWAWQALGNGDLPVALAIDNNGNLIAGGYSGIARWNGSNWTEIGGMNGLVNALAVDNTNNIYAGGSFTIVGGVAANYIAKWNGTIWSTLDSGMDSTVNALALDSTGKLYAGGGFNTAGGVSTHSIARWSGSTWSALGSGINFWDYSLAIDASNHLYAGGWLNFDSVISKWNGTTWSGLGVGTGDTVSAIALGSSGNIYAGGDFTSAGGVSANGIAKWNGSTWSALGTGMGGASPKVNALTLDNSGNLIAGGNFTQAGGVNTNFIAKWNGSAWSALGGGMGNTSNAVYALTKDVSGNIYASGSFYDAGSISADNIAVYVSQDLPANQWLMFSLPHVPVDGATLQSTSMFGDNLSTASYDVTWIVYERNETTKAYRKLAITDPLVQGKSYWIRSTTATTLDMDGTETPVVSQATNPNCTSSKGCYEVTLTSPVAGEASRANLVGFPFFRPASWANVRFEINGTAYTPSNADTGNFAAKTLWKYNGSGYQTFDDVTLGSVGTLSKMEGFWVKLLPASIGKTVKLLLPLS
jgi:hypothetical protein